jgi:hypothetical protein
MVKYFREDLHRKLLSPDFKKQIDGLELLEKVFFIDYVCLKWIIVVINWMRSCALVPSQSFELSLKRTLRVNVHAGNSFSGEGDCWGFGHYIPLEFSLLL